MWYWLTPLIVIGLVVVYAIYRMSRRRRDGGGQVLGRGARRGKVRRRDL